ncbi:pentapeptide repeat-containing protein [Nocardia higoensis]|uniref:pentapeptide repeat-containing protein n=1 Tax=Nocardia higoensis TaxID=228599 RepID=UPI0003129F38|nr:pentapeptide repeat-containing protein [Nocardia higoensis]
MRELHDLPYAAYLGPLEEDPLPEADYDCVHIEGAEYKEIDIRNARFSESALSDLVFAGGNLAHTRCADVWLNRVDMTATSLAETTWLDAEIGGSAWIGVDAGGAELRRVEFTGCKLDGVNFRNARFRDVVFRECVLREPDFAGAKLSSVTFPGSRIDGLTLNETTMTKVDFRGAQGLSIARGIEWLRGATVDHGQLMELAPSFASALGLTVTD